MASNITSTIKQKIIILHRKHPWIRIYFLVLLVLLVWGNLSVSVLPLVESNSPRSSDLSYENFAPNWANHDFIRSFLEPWQRWDSNFYLQIAKEGYGISSPTVAFPPLYPSLIRVVGILIGGQYLLAALLISWSAAFGACFLLEERFAQKVDQKTAVRGIRNLLFFPTAFFFFAGYTESLFLFLVLFAWRYADRGQWLLAGVVGALATMTRFVGIVLVIPFGLMFIDNRDNKNRISWFGLLLIPSAYLGWRMFTSVFFKIQPSYALDLGWALHFDWPWVGFLGSLQLIFSQSISETFFAYMDLLAISLIGISIWWWLRRMNFPEVMFMATVWLISLMKISDSGLLGSTSRYILPLFPMYLMLSHFGSKPKFDRIILITSIFLWLICAALFFTWNWVA